MKLTFSIEYWSPSGVCAGDVEVRGDYDGESCLDIREATVERTGRPFPIRLIEKRDFSEEIAEAIQGDREYRMEMSR